MCGTNVVVFVNLLPTMIDLSKTLSAMHQSVQVITPYSPIHQVQHNSLHIVYQIPIKSENNVTHLESNCKIMDKIMNTGIYIHFVYSFWLIIGYARKIEWSICTWQLGANSPRVYLCIGIHTHPLIAPAVPPRYTAPV